jgi:predicted peroxiredoxin
MTKALEDALAVAELHLIEDTEPEAPEQVKASCAATFESATQAFREVAVGCLLTRICEPDKNIRHPYTAQGDDAFSGRSVDENVVNPFFQVHSIPCSKGPYLSVFRRQVTFEEQTGKGLRDPAGYEGLLNLLGAAQREGDPDALQQYLVYLLWHFLRLREQSQVEMLRLERVSLRQLDRVVKGLLARRSGGLLPLAIVVATVRAISERFGLGWRIEVQGINVADAATAAGGDVTIFSNGDKVMVIEVTERPVDTHRLAATFATKIAPANAEYVFMVHLTSVGPDVIEQAERYFAQGHEVNFVDIAEWVRSTLASTGAAGRRAFQAAMVETLAAPDVPKTVKLAWNEELERVI